MKITKLGHCCMLIEDKGIRILTDPGNFSTAQNDVKNVDIVIITHEHADHFHVASLRTVISHTKSLVVITNASVGKLLDAEGILHEVVDQGKAITVKGITITSDGNKHAVIYKSLPAVQNTGYFIGERLFYPGDAFHKPKNDVEILALPVAGPWMKLSDAIDYALDVRPKVCIPVHDGLLTEQGKGAPYRITEKVLAEANIQFLIIKEKETKEF